MSLIKAYEALNYVLIIRPRGEFSPKTPENLKERKTQMKRTKEIKVRMSREEFDRLNALVHVTGLSRENTFAGSLPVLPSREIRLRIIPDF